MMKRFIDAKLRFLFDNLAMRGFLSIFVRNYLSLLILDNNERSGDVPSSFEGE